MQKLEAKFGIYLRHYLKANPLHTCAIETKQTEKDSIPFDCVKEEQLIYGMAIRSDKGVLIRTVGVEGLPDYVYLRKEPSYIVIKYPKSMHLISVETFIKEKKESKRKSLTSERAKAISVLSVKLSSKAERTQ